MDLEADFWHGKVKTYLVSYKLFKFYAKPKKSADLAHFRKFAILLQIFVICVTLVFVVIS